MSQSNLTVAQLLQSQQGKSRRNVAQAAPRQQVGIPRVGQQISPGADFSASNNAVALANILGDITSSATLIAGLAKGKKKQSEEDIRVQDAREAAAGATRVAEHLPQVIDDIAEGRFKQGKTVEKTIDGLLNPLLFDTTPAMAEEISIRSRGVLAQELIKRQNVVDANADKITTGNFEDAISGLTNPQEIQQRIDDYGAALRIKISPELAKERLLGHALKVAAVQRSTDAYQSAVAVLGTNLSLEQEVEGRKLETNLAADARDRTRAANEQVATLLREGVPEEQILKELDTLSAGLENPNIWEQKHEHNLEHRINARGRANFAIQIDQRFGEKAEQLANVVLDQMKNTVDGVNAGTIIAQGPKEIQIEGPDGKIHKQTVQPRQLLDLAYDLFKDEIKGLTPQEQFARKIEYLATSLYVDKDMAARFNTTFKGISQGSTIEHIPDGLVQNFRDMDVLFNLKGGLLKRHMNEKAYGEFLKAHGTWWYNQFRSVESDPDSRIKQAIIDVTNVDEGVRVRPTLNEVKEGLKKIGLDKTTGSTSLVEQMLSAQMVISNGNATLDQMTDEVERIYEDNFITFQGNPISFQGMNVQKNEIPRLAKTFSKYYLSLKNRDLTATETNSEIVFNGSALMLTDEIGQPRINFAALSPADLAFTSQLFQAIDRQEAHLANFNRSQRTIMAEREALISGKDFPPPATEASLSAHATEARLGSAGGVALPRVSRPQPRFTRPAFSRDLEPLQFIEPFTPLPDFNASEEQALQIRKPKGYPQSLFDFIVNMPEVERQQLQKEIEDRDRRNALNQAEIIRTVILGRAPGIGNPVRPR